MRSFLLLLLWGTAFLRAEEFTITDGASPDGRFTALLIENPKTKSEDTGLLVYEAYLRDKKTGHTVGLESGLQGFCSFEGAKEPVNSRAWWSPDSRFVAFCFRTARHSREPQVYSVIGGRVQKLELPDYDDYIYHRLKLKQNQRGYVRYPVAWSDSKTLQMKAWGDEDECDITLTIQRLKGHRPRIILRKVVKGVALEG